MNIQNKTICIIRPLVFAGIILANLSLINNALLGIIISAIFLYFYGQKLGAVLFSKMEHWFQLPFGALTIVGLNSIILWICFYVYQINAVVFLISLCAVCLAIEFYCDKAKSSFSLTSSLIAIKTFIFDLKPKLFILAYLILLGLNFHQLFLARTATAISSPWNITPNNFFVQFAIASALLILILLKNRWSGFSLFLLCLHTLLISSVALIIYKIGYGYDPFLHLAAIKEIISNGIIMPKIFYYIGEYSIIIFLSNLSQISVEFLNKALLPISFSIFLPISVYVGLTQGLKLEKKYAFAACLSALILPISYFINTTPQGITNLLCLVIIFLSFIKDREMPKWFLLFLAILACAIHPFFGIPILLFVLFLISQNFSRKIIKYFFQSLIILAGLIIFPALFLLNSLLNGFKISFLAPNLSAIFNFNLVFFNKQFNFIHDLFYVYGFNHKLIFLIIALLGIVLIFYLKKTKTFLPHIIASAILLINFIFTKLILNFEFTTNQNREQYLNRILELSLYFLLPIAVYLFYNLFKQSFGRRGLLTLKLFSVFILTIVLVMSLRFSYPIKDNYKDSQEYNVTSADIQTAQLIAQKANSNYIVLGNQMLGAAAIREAGFKHYYNNNFYYSIPNGAENNLYRFYEKMVFEGPQREFAEQAMELAGVNELYFVVADYWSNSQNIITNAKQIADDWYKIEEGANHIFYFNK